jgi:hypothetical protein
MNKIASLLGGREWRYRAWPFPHVSAKNVFRHEVYKALAHQLHQILARGVSEISVRDRLSRNIPGYDAYSVDLHHTRHGPLGLFLTDDWRDILNGLFRIPSTPYLAAAAHYHQIGSNSGFVHNDFNPVWFPIAKHGSPQMPHHQLCKHRSDILSRSGRITVVRGVAMIFFLLNDSWRPSDGGETGLYVSAYCAVSKPTVRVPPISNSLLAFECTPMSYHAFIHNARTPRMSIVMWTHRPLDEALRKYGAERLERFR